MSTTQQIKDRLDIVQYVQQYVPDLKKAGRYYKACCPFHGEKTPSFVVNPDTQSWRCFGACAEGGDVFNFAMKYHNLSFKEALRDLGEKAGVQIEQFTPEQAAQNVRLERLRGMLTTAADYYHRHLMSDADEAVREAYTYATQQRGFTDATLETWQVGYAPAGWRNMLDALRELGYADEEIIAGGLAIHNADKNATYDRFRNRLVIPIHDERGRVVGFGARALDPDDTPKYLNSPQSEVFDKSRTLFGLHRARHAVSDTGVIVIVEGYMDVIQAHQAGFVDVVAQMGTALTETQLQLIAGKAQMLIMALDSDEAGQNATRRSLEVARAALEADYTGKLSLDMRVLQIDGAKDPDDVLRETPELWQQAIKNAKPVADFVIDLETASVSADTAITQRQAIARSVLPILLASENDTYRHENLQKLSMRLRVTEADLTLWAEEIRQQQARQKQNTRRQQARKTNTDTPAVASTAPQPPDLSGMPPVDIYYEGIVTSSNEEPPAFLPDEVLNATQVSDTMPVDLPDFDTIRSASRRTSGQTQMPAASAMSLTMRNNSRAAERYCLRMLLQSHELLYRANRQLRALGQDDQRLMQGPLQEFSISDFSQADYRIIFSTLRASLSQHDLDPLEYLEHELDAELFHDVTQLMDDDMDDVRLALGDGYQADYLALRKDHLHRMGRRSVEDDWLYRILDMRRLRLQRERDELSFLIRDAESMQDSDADQQHNQQYMTILQAWNRLNTELAKQHLSKRS